MLIQLHSLVYLMFLTLTLSSTSSFRTIHRSRIASRFRALPLLASISSSSSSSTPLLAVHVKVSLTPSSYQSKTNQGSNGHSQTLSQSFYKNTIQNARNSVMETGISRFDVLRDLNDSSKCMLVEVYNTKEGPNQHKETSHYAVWRDNVASMMAIPRQASKYHVLFPAHAQWKTNIGAGGDNVNTDHYCQEIPWDVTPFAAEGMVTQKNGSPSPESLLAVVVDIKVKAGSEDAFIAATIANCENSIKEAGIHRFDFLRNAEDPSNFVLVEMYNNPNAAADHKATAHYATWAKTVADMMERPRSASRYASLFPKPLFYHNSALSTHRGEGINGERKGLSTVTGHSFSFLSPKLTIGRNIACAAVSSALKNDLNAKKPLIITGKTGFARHKAVFDAIAAAVEAGDSNDLVRYAVNGEPTVEDVEAAVALGKQRNCDCVIALGGGSAIDLGKAVSAMLTNSGDVYDYLEVVGKGQSITQRPLPTIAIPTTSGTGSECTKNAVIKSLKHGRKASIRHDSMLPSVAIIDPALTISCPSSVTAHVGLDTLCQLIEPYTSNAANPITDALAREGMLRSARSLRHAVADTSDMEAREDLAVASVLGGLCLANAKLGVVHGFASVIGGMYEHAPHGAICAALMPSCFRTNVEKLMLAVEEGSDLQAAVRLNRFTEVSRIITGDINATAMMGAVFLEALVRDLQVPPLTKLCIGMKADEAKEIVEGTLAASSTKGNPVVLSAEDLQRILTSAM